MEKMVHQYSQSYIQKTCDEKYLPVGVFRSLAHDYFVILTKSVPFSSILIKCNNLVYF